MRFGQFVTLSVFCRLVAVVTLALSGCVLYVGDDAPPVDLDAGVPDAPAVDAVPPDAEVLEACEEVCEDQEFNEWVVDGDCIYMICRPSYRHCMCQEDYPSCESMGCDGTQEVPLYCPEDGSACFCAAPTAPDGWCVPAEPFLSVRMSVDTKNTAVVDFHAECPPDSPSGTHQGAIELFVGMQADARSFSWTCESPDHTETWTDLPCGTEVWARGVAIHPVTGNPVYRITALLTTAACS